MTRQRTDGLAKNNRDNVLFSSLLIGLSVDFFARVVRARACRVCVRVCACVCTCVYVCVIIKMFITKKNH